MLQTLTSYLPYLPWMATAFAIYAALAALWVITDNRDPQSTFAWIFLLFFFPPIGVITYLFVGRGWRAFSREGHLLGQALQGDDNDVLSRYAENESRAIAEMASAESVAYKRKLLNLVHNNANSSLTTRNQLKILQNAEQKYPQLLADIEAASDCIHMAYYIWEEDEWTNKLKDLLIRKAQDGVEVRLLGDAQGLTVSRKYMRELREGGVQIYEYYNYRSLFKIHTISYRNHRKIVVIDGNIGFVGGLNLSQEHLDGGPYFQWWRDTHLRVEGQAARVLQGIFATSWFNTTGESLSIERYMPALADEFTDSLPIHITTSGPDSQWNAIRQLYFQMIMAAEERLYIQSPFFIPDTSIMEALKAAALSGIDVKLMCAPRGTAYTLPYWAANTYFADLVEAGARVFLYQEGYFHAKTVNIDSAVCSIGSANMDIRSFSINYEVNAVIYDEGVAKELEDDFIRDLEHCTEFTLETYEAQGYLSRLRDSLCRLASPLL